MTAPKHGFRTEEIEPAHAVPDQQIYAEIADVLESAGRTGFYDVLSRFVARATGCDQRLVMRYAAYERPAFLVNGFMTPEAVDLYLGGLHRLDPLQEIARRNREPVVVNLRSLQPDDQIEEQYLAEIFKIAFIFDELAFMLPSHGGVTVAICCEKCVEPFTEVDRENARAMLPLIAALHRQHVDAVFAAALRRLGQTDASGIPGAVLVQDCTGRTVFANEAWHEHAGSKDLEQALSLARSDEAAHVTLDDEHVLHRDSLGEEFSIAPGGTLWMIERRSDGPIRVSATDAVDAFCRRHDLTPREAEIVKLILLGFPNSKIAERLGVSAGTVKNHRWRLYYKLDITTERELFHQFLTALLSMETGRETTPA